jgi:hypothetical protein
MVASGVDEEVTNRPERCRGSAAAVEDGLAVRGGLPRLARLAGLSRLAR